MAVAKDKAELGAARRPSAEAEAAVIRAAEGAWGREFVAEAPSPEEWQAAERLVSERYACDRWTRRR